MEVITSIQQLDLSKEYSYRDYLAWQFDDMVELVRGRIMKMSPAPLTQHQIIVGRLISDIERHLRRKPCQVFVAPFDVRLAKKKSGSSDEQILTVVQPDLCIVCDPSKIDRRGCLGVPDMIIEVLSPGNMDYDTKVKFGIYEEFGVNEYWIVSPGDENVVVYHLQNGKYALHREYAEPGDIPIATLPGFSLEWSELFL